MSIIAFLLFPSKRNKASKKKKKKQLKSFTFAPLLLYIKDKRTCFVGSSGIDIKKLLSNAASESTKGNKICVRKEINGRVIRLIKPLLAC